MDTNGILRVYKEVRELSDIEIPTVTKFIEFVKDLDNLCKKYHITYDTVETTVELLDDFGWEHHPAMILSAMEKNHRGCKEGE